MTMQVLQSQRSRFLPCFVHRVFGYETRPQHHRASSICPTPRGLFGVRLNTVRCRLFARASLSQLQAEGVKLRMADEDDTQALARLTTLAFCEQDELLKQMRALAGSNFEAFVRLVEAIFIRLSIRDIAMQLNKRLKPVGSEDKRVHVVLLAEETETGEVVGCVEMGLVKIRKLSGSRAGYAVAQWEKTIEEAKRGRMERDENAILGGRAPYIGNLAVSQKFRRLGIASSLVTEACRQAEQLWDAPCVYLHVEVKNAAASRLYRKLDFGCEARDPEWVEEVGKNRTWLLRSTGGNKDWEKCSKITSSRLNPVEYIRWCMYDLSRTRKERENE